jgi:Primase X
MLRIPGSVNSKNGKYVGVVHEWDKSRPEINRMLLNFRLYMINHKYLEILNSRKRRKTPTIASGNSGNNISWIERLLQTPLSDCRKYCIWRIMTPYLLNIRKLSDHVVTNIIIDWLNQCDRVRKLDFNYNQKIREGIESAAKGYLPISREKLKEENKELSIMLQNQNLDWQDKVWEI